MTTFPLADSTFWVAAILSAVVILALLLVWWER